MSPDVESPFFGTAQYYDRFRAPYAPEALDLIAQAFNLGSGNRALDLGCGPGTIAIPLSKIVAEVVAVDPDCDMIREGRRLAAAGDRKNIVWLHSKAEDVSTTAGRFQVATLGQSFHWMDRDAVLQKLALLLCDGGGLALVAGGQRRPQESWEPLARVVVEQFLGPRLRHPRANPQEPRHEPALLRSRDFAEFTCHEFSNTITRDVESIIGCIYSVSSSSRPLFGKNAKAFEMEITRALLRVNPTGLFEEQIETEVLLAPKKIR